jgi:signal transduction histidine kinase
MSPALPPNALPKSAGKRLARAPGHWGQGGPEATPPAQAATRCLAGAQGPRGPAGAPGAGAWPTLPASNSAWQTFEPAQAPAPTEADAAPKQVPRFLSHVVHELRNTIGGVMGLSSLLLKSELDDKQRRHAQALQCSSNTLLQLVNDLLDLAKIESGHFALHDEPLALRPWLDEVVAPYKALGDLKGVTVLAAWQAPLPETVHVDPLRLRQVLSNLLSNALKFTRCGRVMVSLAAQPLALPGQWQLALAVQDTGVGMAPEALGQLFEEFRQADNQLAGAPGGTGLGLALCKQLVQRMGGEIGVSSEPGVGSRFWFTVVVHGPVAVPVAADASGRPRA